LIPAPPAETVQAPSARETPPPVEPPPPEPEKPKPKPKKPNPKPKPKPEPLPEAPPSERAITREETPPPEEEAAPPPPPPPVTTPSAEDNDSLGAPVTPPREDAHQLNNPRPAYPALSRRLREQGTVLLEILILPDGTVGEVKIKESSGFKRLDDTAVKAVKQWRYTPARSDNGSLGAPVTPPREDAHQLNNPRPAYPALSRRLREQGTVLLEILILPDGTVGEVKIKESSGFKRLDDTAVKAVKQWRYTPA